MGLISLLAIFWLVERRRRVVVCAARDDAVSLFYMFLSFFVMLKRNCLGTNGLISDVMYRCRECFTFKHSCRLCVINRFFSVALWAQFLIISVFLRY